MEHGVPTPKRQGGGWWCWGGTRRGQGQQDPVWQSLVAQGGGPKWGRGMGVVYLAPPLAGHWEGLGKEQGLVTGMVLVGWDFGGVGQ